MEENKGITIVTLVITIALLMIIAGVGVNVSTRIIKKMDVENVKTDMLLIQAKVKVQAEKNSFDSEQNPLVGTQITLTDEEYTKYGMEKPEEEEKFYKLSQEDLATLKLDSITLDENDSEKVYIVNYETSEIIYKKGVENDKNQMFYTLSQISNQ